MKKHDSLKRLLESENTENQEETIPTLASSTNSGTPSLSSLPTPSFLQPNLSGSPELDPAAPFQAQGLNVRQEQEVTPTLGSHIRVPITMASDRHGQYQGFTSNQLGPSQQLVEQLIQQRGEGLPPVLQQQQGESWPQPPGHQGLPPVLHQQQGEGWTQPPGHQGLLPVLQQQQGEGWTQPPGHQGLPPVLQQQQVEGWTQPPGLASASWPPALTSNPPAGGPGHSLLLFTTHYFRAAA